MPKMPLHPASGTGIVRRVEKVIRFARYGCTNRPFFHIVVMQPKAEQRQAPIEQLGTYDPCPNQYNEKLAAFNFERIQYWIANGAHISKPVAEILGLAGFLPIYPTTYMYAWRKRAAAEAAAAEAAAADAAKEDIAIAAESK